MRYLIAILISLLAFIHSSQARDLHGKFGLGYNNQFSNARATNGVPAISVKYGLSRATSIAGIFGINTGTPGNSVVGAKFASNFFYETNLNFYFFVGGGYVSANSSSGFEALGGFGAEFFIPGIESLGFAFEVGGSFNNASGSYVIETLGVNPLNAGIHFYF